MCFRAFLGAVAKTIIQAHYQINTWLLPEVWGKDQKALERTAL